MADLTAVGLYTQFWLPDVPQWTPVLIAIVSLLAFLAFVLVVLALAEDTRIALFVTPVWFIMLNAIFQIRKTKIDAK